MKEVDRPFVGPELSEKRPVVGRGDGDQRQVGPRFPDMGDLGGELRLQRRLAGFRHTRKARRSQAIAIRVMESDGPAGRLAPARLSGRSGTMTLSSEVVAWRIYGPLRTGTARSAARDPVLGR